MSPAASDPPPSHAASRTILQGDGVAWLASASLPPSHAIVTSLPDVSEQHARSLDAWSAWFTATVALACRQVADTSVAIFFQSDIRRDGIWVDKGTLVAEGARQAGAACLFHRIVCRAPAGTPLRGRPGYAHLQAFSRGLRLERAPAEPDVLAALGEMPWPRAMGTAACEAVCRFLLASTPCRVVVDPFCGLGTMLAVANAYGLDAVGVERSAPRAARARSLRFERGTGLSDA